MYLFFTNIKATYWRNFLLNKPSERRFIYSQDGSISMLSVLTLCEGLFHLLFHFRYKIIRIEIVQILKNFGIESGTKDVLVLKYNQHTEITQAN